MARGDSAKTHKTKMKVQFQATGERKVVASFRSVDEAARTNTQGLEGFRGGLLAIDAAMGIATTTMAALGTAFNAIKVPVGLAVDFEKQFASIRTLSSSIGSELESQLLDLASRVPQTAGDIAESAYAAISAGIDPTRTVEFLEAASKAAVAGNSTLTESTQALTKTLAGFKEQGLEAERAMDVLFATVKSGDTNFTELAASVGMVAGAAGVAGIPIEEMGAAIATMSKTAPSTSIAVTNLNAVIKTLTKPTTQSIAAFKELGVEVGALQVKERGLVPILRDLSRAIDGDVEKLNSLTQSTEAQAGFNALLSESMKGLEADLDAVTNSEGALNDANKILADTTQNALDQFNAATEGALREIGFILLPEVRKGLDNMSGWWTKNGKTVIAGVEHLWEGISGLTKAALYLNDVFIDTFLKVTGIKLFTGALFELSEALGITSVRADELSASMWDMREASNAAIESQSSDTQKAIKEQQELLEARISTGDATVAEHQRITAIFKLSKEAQRLATVQVKQGLEAERLDLERFNAESEEGATNRVALLKTEVLNMLIRRNATARDVEAVKAATQAIKEMDVEAQAAAAREAKRADKPGGSGGGALNAARNRARDLVRIREQGLKWEAELIEDAFLRELTMLSAKHQKEREMLIAAGEEAAELRSVLDSKQEQDRRKIIEKFEAADAAKRETAEAARVSFENDITDRRLALIEDESARRLAALATAQERELSLARKGGQDIATLRAVQDKEMAVAQREAAESARAAQLADMEQWSSRIREGGQLTVNVMESIAKGAEIIGIQGDLAQKALAVTKGFVSAADAINYGAQSAAAFASFNYFSGAKYAAAALGSGVASVAYFKAAGSGGGSTAAPSLSSGGGGGGTAPTTAAPASAADLGQSSSSSGSTSLTYQINFQGPVFDTQEAVDRMMAEGVRRELRRPGGVRVV